MDDRLDQSVATEPRPAGRSSILPQDLTNPDPEEPELKPEDWAAAGGGGFFLACEDFGRMFGNSFPASAFFFLTGD